MYKPTNHYHIGTGVAWALRKNTEFDCKATLPHNVFRNLEGGDVLLCSFGGITELRIYDSEAEAIAALEKALALS